MKPNAASQGRRRSAEIGSVYPEFAIGFPVLILLVAGVVDFSMAGTNHTLYSAALAAAAREAAITPYDCDGTVDADEQSTVVARNRYTAEVSRFGLPSQGQLQASSRSVGGITLLRVTVLEPGSCVFCATLDSVGSSILNFEASYEFPLQAPLCPWMSMD